MPPKDTKLRARQEILHYVLSFCVCYTFASEPERVYPSSTGFRSCLLNREAVQVGDLIILSSAPASKYTIGWLKEIDASNPGWPRYLIESLEDQSECWWSNVGVDHFPRDKLDPAWRWTDRQWAFKDRWWAVCYKEKGAYMSLPLWPEFGPSFDVTLGTRTRFGFDDMKPTRTFPDWRKVTKAMMRQCYDECVAEHERHNEEHKASKGEAA
jgi:hypothetical protein